MRNYCASRIITEKMSINKPNGKKRIFHLIPAGITQEGKTNILGNGMVLDLGVLVHELDGLDGNGVSYDNLMISEDAHVIMPYHIERDQKRNQSQKDGGIGTTGRGVGPAYSDKTARIGVMVRDLYDADFLAEKIEKARESYPEQNIDIEEIIEKR